MLIEDDIYLKPDCSPQCNHTEICTRCGRPHCIKSMQHSRLHGYTCVCGSQDWLPVISYPKPAGQPNTGLQGTQVYKGQLVRMVNRLSNIIIEASGKNGYISSNDLDYANDCLDKVIPLLKYLRP